MLLREGMQPRNMVVLFLASAVAALDAEATAIGPATGPAAGGGGGAASHPNKILTGGGAEGVAELSSCAREVAACSDDSECGGCSAVVMGWGQAETAELSRHTDGGDGGDGSTGVGAGSGGDLFLGAGGPPVARCERVGAAVCRGVSAAAAQEVWGGGQEEGGLRAPRSTKGCGGNHEVVQELLVCRLRAAGCEPDDAPCIMPEKQQGGGKHKNLASPAPRPRPDNFMELAAGRARAVPAAEAADVEASPTVFGWETRNVRRLTTSREDTCEGILHKNSCCGAACDVCGGPGCWLRGDGAAACCTKDILDAGVLCSDTGGLPPCIVEGKG